MKYIILHRLGQGTDYGLRSEEGHYILADLSVDGSFPEFDNAPDFLGFLDSLVGREIEIEELRPLVYSAVGVKLLATLPHAKGFGNNTATLSSKSKKG